MAHGRRRASGNPPTASRCSRARLPHGPFSTRGDFAAISER
jgi:hypothetical protein